MDQVTLVGRLGRDAAVRVTPSGRTLVTLSVATAERYKDRDGAWHEHTEWHRVLVWSDSERSAGLAKGEEVLAVGRISSRRYEDKAGEKRVSFEVDCSGPGHFVRSLDRAQRAVGGAEAVAIVDDDEDGPLPF